MLKQLQSLLAAYGQRNLIIIALQGIASGLPIVLIGSTLTIWLSESGLSRTMIGFASAIWLPYSLKFLWAPFIDLTPLPFLSRWLGRRRSWILLSQTLLIVGLIGLGHTDPAIHLKETILWALMIAICSATQDAVIDSYRIELLTQEQQSPGVAATTTGYRVGMLIAGAGGLMLAEHVGWHAMYWSMCVVIGLAMIATWFGIEPTNYRESPFSHLKKHMSQLQRAKEVLQISVVQPFADFMTKQGWLWLLLFIIAFKIPDAFAAAMTNPLLIELGFSKQELAAVIKLYGFIATIFGAVVGGILPFRYGIITSLWVAVLTQAFSNLTLLWQYYAGHDLWVLVGQVTIENFFGAMGGTILVSYMSRICTNPLYTATQYALLSALAALGRTTLSTWSGWTVDHYGWVVFVFTSITLALPSLVLLHYARDILASFEERQKKRRQKKGA